MAMNKVEEKLLAIVREEKSISQKDLFARKVAGVKAMRNAMNKLFSTGYLDKEAADNGAITWKVFPDNAKKVIGNVLDSVVEATAKIQQEDHSPAEKAVSAAHEEMDTKEQELRAAFTTAGMTKNRADLMAHKVIQGQLTEKQVLGEWAKNPANPNLKGKPSKKLTDKLKKAKNDDAKVKEEKKAAKKAKKAPAKPRFTRQCALVGTFKACPSSLTKDELLADANERYVKSGGKDNIKEQAWVYNNCIKILTAMGWVKIHDDGIHEVLLTDA
jgi:hypothetical protein